MIKLSATAKKAIDQYTLEKYPEEMCGILVEDSFIPITNEAINFLDEFLLSPREVALYVGKIQAVIHSHTYDAKRPPIVDICTPSVMDMLNQKSSEVPWFIVGSDGTVVTRELGIPRKPHRNYIGRPFIWFINDCYTLVQDYYMFELNIILPEHPMDKDYHNIGNYDRIIKDYIKDFGFSETDSIDDMRNGDLLLLSRGVSNCNHIGVYHNGGVLHQGAVSVDVPFSTFIGRIHKVLKYDNIS